MSTKPSPENFLPPTNKVDHRSLCTAALEQLCLNHRFLGAVVVEWDETNDNFFTVAASRIPLEALNGSEKGAVRAVIEDCFLKHPVAHVHNVGNLALPNIARRLGKWPDGTQRAVFVPKRIESRFYVFLGFISPKEQKFELSARFNQALETILAIVNVTRNEEALALQAESTQNFVREVGHDFASSVQAIISKVRNIHDGRVPPAAMKKKLHDIEMEIKAAYGLADQLGLTVDLNYQMRSHEEFSVRESLEAAIEQVGAEAHERKLTFKTYFSTPDAILGGDKLGLQTCWMHLLMNAIKYSYGGNVISISAVREGSEVKVEIENRGHPLPAGDERNKIWEFGYRGEAAMELHVNGSGVGLFTVKKIVVGHHGRVRAFVKPDHTNVFQVHLPVWEHLRKQLLVR